MDRELADARRAHRDLTRAQARAAELEQRRRAAILTALAAGATQADIARALNLDPSTIHRIIRGAGPRRRA
jgi:DNA-binding NarL/FixJ family response regulator